MKTLKLFRLLSMIFLDKIVFLPLPYYICTSVCHEADTDLSLAF